MGNLVSWIAWLHLAAVVVAIGGSAFTLLVLRPVALRLLGPQEAMRLMGAVQRRFRWVIWGAILTLVVTGVWLSWGFRGVNSLDALFDSSFGRTLFTKSALALALFAIALSVTLPIERLAWFRRHQVGLIRSNLLLAAVIILLASLMVRYGGVF